MRFLKNLIVMVALLVAVSNAKTQFTFNTFSIRNSEDQTCFTKTAKTVEDSTKVDINKCTVGCGGSMKIHKGIKSQQYQFELFSSQDCTGESTLKKLFICPNPSTDPFAISSTSYSVKCGTLPPDAEVNQDEGTTNTDENNTNETKPKPTPKTKSPSTSNTHNSNDISGLSSEEKGSSSKSSPKSKSSTETVDETESTKPKSVDETANGNSASSTIATFSLVIMSLLAATLL
ncbi:hypothetical protein RB653_009125 [Dictyostelium firmibasis]|uniref:Uncharacterized protein n=1 Tax=Dictyostelium firmibasis TaxID=79012 RepID=A0AAN7YX45_9MYCE